MVNVVSPAHHCPFLRNIKVQRIEANEALLSEDVRIKNKTALPPACAQPLQDPFHKLGTLIKQPWVGFQQHAQRVKIDSPRSCQHACRARERLSCSIQAGGNQRGAGEDVLDSSCHS
jgi:hypothetical protein